MVNEINENGLIVQTLPEIIAEITDSYKSIYGQDISVDSNTPDGQLINIEAMSKADTLDLATMVYNMFNVDTVRGVPQDILYKINNVYRKSSEFTFVQVNVTTTQPLNLQGLDSDITNPSGIGYTVADNSGNQFILSNSISLTGAGTYTLEFRAKELGAIEVLPNTIVNMITIVSGVSSVNNPAIQYILGTSEETGQEFATRRNASTAISGKGFQDAFIAQLNSIPLVEFATVYNNTNNVPDAEGIPANGFWAIVEGGADANIAQVIYANMGMGNPMKGSSSYTITKANGETVDIKWDRPVAQPLYVKMTVQSKVGQAPDVDFLKRYLVENKTFGVYEKADATGISCKIVEGDDSITVVLCQVSTDGTNWSGLVAPNSRQNFFTLDIANVEITVVM